MSKNDPQSARIRQQVVSLAMIAVGMLLLAYASVPLYRMFCQVTGFGGTPMLASSVPDAVSERTIRVRFNADTAPGLPWAFAPVERSVTVHLGESKLAVFTAENESGEPVRGVATYNVVPHTMGQYFQKVQCFCFEEQLLKPHEKVNMPVSFFIDPAMLKDPETRGLTEVTLSYSFFEKKR